MSNSFCIVLLCGLMMASPVVGSSQTRSAASQAEMEKLEFLVGEWKGKGWSYRFDGSPGGEVSQSTKAKRGKDGLTLSINGKKKHPDLRMVGGGTFPAIQNYPMVRFDTFSVYFDEGSKRYYWLSESPPGRKKPFPASLVDARTLQLTFDSPDFQFQITIKVTEDGKWHERFDVWRGNNDGWFKFEETELTRVK